MEKITFDKEKHEYKLGDKVLPSVTQILESTLFEKKYEGVNDEVLMSAAKRGEYIHKEIETYIKTGGIGFTNELLNFIDIKETYKLKDLKSETLVYTDKMAGTIDIIGVKGGRGQKKKNILADIKTTYKLDKEYVSWQLSFYAYILEHTSDIKIDELYGIWLREDKSSFVKVERKSDSQIEEVLHAYENGVKIDFDTTTLQTIPQETQIDFCGYMEQIKAMEEKTKAIKEAILKEMEERGLQKIEIGNISITYKAPSTKTSVDTVKLKVDGIYDKYTKTSNVKSSITIKIKE